MSDQATAGKGLDLAVVGNSRVGALIDTNASVVWMCVPRFDGDPVFCALLDGNSREGRFDIELEQRTSIKQHYLANTAILRTEMEDANGGRKKTKGQSSQVAAGRGRPHLTIAASFVRVSERKLRNREAFAAHRSD